MKQRQVSRDLALIAVFAALVAVLSIMPAIALPGVAVPITFQTVAVCLCGLVLGGWRGCLAISLWLLVGFAGVPVFSKGGATLAVLTGPSAGYLIAFLPAALCLGIATKIMIKRVQKSFVRIVCFSVLSFAASIFIIYPGGALGMMFNLHMNSFGEAYAVNLAFIPLDVLKAILAGVIAEAVHKAFPTLLVY